MENRQDTKVKEKDIWNSEAIWQVQNCMLRCWSNILEDWPKYAQSSLHGRRFQIDIRQFSSHVPKDWRVFIQELAKTKHLDHFINGGHKQFFGGGMISKDEKQNGNKRDNQTQDVEVVHLEVPYLCGDSHEMEKFVPFEKIENMSLTQQHKHLQRLDSQMAREKELEDTWFHSQKGWRYSLDAFPILQNSLLPKFPVENQAALDDEKVEKDSPSLESEREKKCDNLNVGVPPRSLRRVSSMPPAIGPVQSPIKKVERNKISCRQEGTDRNKYTGQKFIADELQPEHIFGKFTGRKFIADELEPKHIFGKCPNGEVIEQCLGLAAYLTKHNILERKGRTRAAFVMTALDANSELHSRLARIARYLWRIQHGSEVNQNPLVSQMKFKALHNDSAVLILDLRNSLQAVEKRTMDMPVARTYRKLLRRSVTAGGSPLQSPSQDTLEQEMQMILADNPSSLANPASDADIDNRLHSNDLSFSEIPEELPSSLKEAKIMDLLDINSNLYDNAMN
eukprot:CAMPEP_0114502200 /NCGR_PEP_ID=MMETSP0109-20121206/8933_1 /TAXON_ID=29199 /ORGANISM="Chlorarachnion reptans, Strain CCCM449" /LENGTH=507 /DNA_ID=CAMNT_0001680037 /DNA_START=473 /DNA_END=1996 /DNA_ORIENTATION=-